MRKTIVLLALLFTFAPDAAAQQRARTAGTMWGAVGVYTTGRILSQYNVGAQTRRTANVVWHDEDVLEIHPHDAENRGIRDGDFVRLASRSGETTLRATITDTSHARSMNFSSTHATPPIAR